MRWKPYKLKDGTDAEATIASDAGYCICKSYLEQFKAYRYIAFHGRSGNAHFHVLGGYDSEKEAKAACNAHEAKAGEVAA